VVESRVVLGGATVSTWPEPVDPRILPRRTGWKLERGIDRAVDDAGLKVVVRIAKGDRRRHGAVAAEYASATVSATKRQLVLSLALSLDSHLD